MSRMQRAEVFKLVSSTDGQWRESITLQMPNLARDNGCVCMCWCWCWWPPLIIVMSIFMCRWVAAGQRQWAVTAAAVSPLYTPSLAAPDWSYHCHVNIAQTQCHHTRMVILVTQRRLAGQCQRLNTAYNWSVSWGFTLYTFCMAK